MKKQLLLFLMLLCSLNVLSQAIERTENGTSFDDGANNPVNEGEAQAFDNNNNSKWLIFNSTGNIGYDFANDDAYAINSYSITSGNDAPDRDPKNWNLQGSNDGVNWANVDSQNNQIFGNRSETKTYNISNTTTYRMFRLNITANNGSGLIQIAEIQMFSGSGGGGGTTPTERTENGTSIDDGANNPVGEGEAQAFDNNNGSKWLIFNSTGNIGYDFANNDAYAINSYSVTSGNDAPDRDPKNWNLQGSNDGVNWANVDSQNNQIFGNRSETKTYNISNTTAYQMYRLNVTANNGSGLLQIAEIQMFSGSTGGGGGGGGTSTDRTENGTSIDDGANNPVGEGEAQAFDNNNGSKWLIFNPTGNIGYDFANNDAYSINSYSITSGNDAPDRDPKNWNLQGSDDGANWTTIDSQNNQIFGNRSETKTYNISNTTAYKIYRLNVTANNGSGLLQIAEIQMFGPAGTGGGNPNARVAGVLGITSFRPLQIGDPNLDPNWDWTQPVYDVYFRNSQGNISPNQQATSPFWNSSTPFGDVDINKVDMYKEDGWMLVTRDFGSPTGAVRYPFFVLYNKYKGILRVGIFRGVDFSTSYQTVSLSFVSSSPRSSIMAFADNNISKTFRNIYNDGLIQEVLAYDVGLTNWICADFNLIAYDDNINFLSTLEIKIREVTSTGFDAKGVITLDGTAIPKVTSSESNPVVDFLKKAGSAGEFVTKNKSKALEFIVNKTTFTPAIKSGFSSFLGGLSKVLPALGTVGEVLKFFVGDNAGTTTSSTFDLHLNGGISLSGALVQSSTVDVIPIGIINNGTQTAYNTVQNIPWGVVSLNGLINVPVYSETGIDPNVPHGNYQYREFVRGIDPNPLFNPNVVNTSVGGMTLESISYGYSFAYPNLNNTTKYYLIGNKETFLTSKFYTAYGNDYALIDEQTQANSLNLAFIFSVNQNPNKPTKNIADGKIVIFKRFGTGCDNCRALTSKSEPIVNLPYPNPSPNEVNIPLSNSKGDNYELNISSVDGKRIHNKSGIADIPNMNIPWSGETGNYVVETIVNGIRKTSKISIIK